MRTAARMLVRNRSFRRLAIRPLACGIGGAWLDFRRNPQPFQAAASGSGVSDCDFSHGRAIRLSRAASDALFLPALGIEPVLGRNFTPAGGIRALRRVAFLVAQRTRETGVPMALGATPAAVSRPVQGNAALWLTGGAAAGAALSLAVSRALGAILLGVSGRNPAAWMGAAARLLLSALAAAWLPARRAARVDPMEALRHE